MIDILAEIAAIQREVSRYPDGDSESVTVTLHRSYPTTAEDVWEAITTPERIKRWFVPVTGDLREGGTFQLEGNAGGQILTCDKPRLLSLTYGGESSIVHLRLTADSDDEATLEVEHTVPIGMAQSGAGSLYVGPGWDGGLLALALYLRGEGPGDPVAASTSLERQQFSVKSVQAWAAAVTTSGTATEEELAAGLDMALKHYAPDVPS